MTDRARDHRSFDEKFGNSWFVDLEEGETNETERERESGTHQGRWKERERHRDMGRNWEEKTGHNGPFIKSRDTKLAAPLHRHGPSIKPSDLASPWRAYGEKQGGGARISKIKGSTMDGNQWLVFGQCRNAAFQSLADNNALSLVYKSAHCCQLKSSRDERDEERGGGGERERDGEKGGGWAG